MTTNKRNVKKDVHDIKELYDALNTIAAQVQRIESENIEMYSALNTLAVRVKMIESENIEMRRIIMSLEHKISSK